MKRAEPGGLARYVPILTWGRKYSAAAFADDALAAAIVAIMLVPQSLAYALLAGLPPEVGLYASIAPLIVYALLGTGHTLAVGPVAVVSLMTAVAAGKVATQGSPEYIGAAIALALISGGLLFVLGVMRFGFVANFLSHPVISGFISASGLLIAASQLGRLTGVDVEGDTFFQLAGSFLSRADEIHPTTAIIGATSLLFLFWMRYGASHFLKSIGLKQSFTQLATKVGPMLAVVAATVIVYLLGLSNEGVAVVGRIPAGLPPIALPKFDAEIWEALLPSAALISIVGFVESVAIARTLAARRRERIDPDQELIALGGANLAAGFTGGFPVTGGLARSTVNFDAGARTPAAGALTAIAMLGALLFMGPAAQYLPQASLSATIIVAVLSVVDIKTIGRIWRYSKSDFWAMAVTITATLAIGVEAGVGLGVTASLALFLFRTSRPHFAIVGLVPNTEHFRNIDRHMVQTDPQIISLRIDESLYFANSRFLEDAVYGLIAAQPAVRHIIMMASAINEIDASALESLEEINRRLKDAGITLHLSEVKGPVMDRLKRSDFLDHLSGRIFLTQYEAYVALRRDATARGDTPDDTLAHS